MLSTVDGRYILKFIPREERDLLCNVLEQYLEHLTINPHSLLVRFTGVYEVRLQSRKVSDGLTAGVLG